MIVRIFLLAATLLFFAPSVMAQEGCQDQAFEPEISPGNWINGTLSSAQTFTVGIGGQLQRVEVFVDYHGSPEGPLVVDLREIVSTSKPRRKSTLTRSYVPR